MSTQNTENFSSLGSHDPTPENFRWNLEIYISLIVSMSSMLAPAGGGIFQPAAGFCHGGWRLRAPPGPRAGIGAAGPHQDES